MLFIGVSCLLAARIVVWPCDPTLLYHLLKLALDKHAHTYTTFKTTSIHKQTQKKPCSRYSNCFEMCLSQTHSLHYAFIGVFTHTQSSCEFHSHTHTNTTLTKKHSQSLIRWKDDSVCRHCNIQGSDTCKYTDTSAHSTQIWHMACNTPQHINLCPISQVPTPSPLQWPLATSHWMTY